MAKIVKQKYIKANGEKAIYSYLIPVANSKIETSGIDVDKPIKIEIKNGKIIISN